MADPTPAIEYVLANEGGYNPNDNGSPSNFGIRQADHPGLEVNDLTRDEAILIYQRDYWKFGDVVSQRLANKLLDVYVNEEHIGIRILQQALGFLQAGPIVCDGIWGPITAEHANAADPDALVDEFKAQLCMHIFGLFPCPANPSREEWGLIRRAVKG